MLCSFRSVWCRVGRVPLCSLRVVDAFLVVFSIVLRGSFAMELGSVFVLVGGASMTMSALVLVCCHPFSSYPALTRTTVFTMNGFLLVE